MVVEWQREHDVACQIATDAAQEIARLYHQDMEVRYKTPIEPVTEADMIADRVLHEGLLGAFPADGWLSEESADDLVRLQRRRVWIVDPLDGTREFIIGRPEFMVSVALVDNGQPVVGVCVNPITSEVYSAILGHGAQLDGQTIRVTTGATCHDAPTVVSRSETRRGLLRSFEPKCALEPMGGMANKLMAVASGRACATFTLRRRCEWDIAAGALILSEAGGRLTSLSGAPYSFNQESPYIHGMLGSNGTAHTAFLEMISETTEASK